MGRLLTTAQVCEKLSISRRHLQTLRGRGLFRTIRVSERSLRFDEDEIDAYVRGQSFPAPPPAIRPSHQAAPDRLADYQWLDENGDQYAGRWVALLEGQLIGAAPTLPELRRMLAGLELPQPVLVHRVER